MAREPAARAGEAVPPKRKRKRRDPRWARVLVVFGALLMVSAGGGILGGNALFSYATRSVAQQDLLGEAGNQSLKKGHVTITGAKNILLIGIDARPNQNAKDAVRADSIIILHIPAAHNAAYLVSIPRDTWVKIPAYDNGARKFTGGYDKINGAYAAGGQGLSGDVARTKAVGLLALTIKERYGIGFDAAAIVDFVGFQKVVEVLGGVDMYVDQETTSVHIGYDKNGKFKVPYRQYDKADGSTGLDRIAGVTPQVYHVGQQHLLPWQALDYVRQRELLPHSDYDRQRHQQQFIKALFKAVLGKDVLTNPLKLNQVLDVIGKSMTVDSGGIDLEDWMFGMKGITGDGLITLKTNNGTFHASPEQSGAEALDATTLALLDSIRTDTVEVFIGARPDLVTNS